MRIKIGLYTSVIVVVAIFITMWLRSTRLATIWVGDIELQVEIRNTPKGLKRGLMHRKKLSENQGMLFVFEEPGFHSFWMKNTYIPLSIAFISENKEIVQINNMFPLDTLHPCVPRKPIKYAIEVNQGWFDRHKINVGDRVRGIP